MASSELVAPGESATDVLVREITEGIGFQVEDAGAVGDAIVAKILSSTDVESIFRLGGLEAGKQWIDRPMTVLGVSFNESHFEDGLGVYAVLDAVDPESGESVAIGTSGRQSMAQLWAAHKIGAFPLDLVIRQAKNPSKNGFRAQWLELAR